MLLADYSIDLSGARGTSPRNGIIRYERAEIAQVLPRPGRYRVSCECAGDTRAAELAVREDSVDLAVDVRERVEAVVFR